MTVDLKKIALRHFDELAKYYDAKSAKRATYNNAIDRMVLSYLVRQKNPMVLDAGCGTGTRAENLKKELAGAKFYCIDLSAKMIKIAKTKNLDFVARSSMTQLPFPDRKFDNVICLFNSFGYLPKESDRHKSLDEFWRVLKPHGFLFIDVLNSWHLGESIGLRQQYKFFKDWARALTNPALSFGDKLFTLEFKDIKTEGFVHGFTDGEMRRLFSNSNFLVEKFMIVGYNSGKVKKDFRQGQFFYICRKV